MVIFHKSLILGLFKGQKAKNNDPQYNPIFIYRPLSTLSISMTEVMTVTSWMENSGCVIILYLFLHACFRFSRHSREGVQ